MGSCKYHIILYKGLDHPWMCVFARSLGTHSPRIPRDGHKHVSQYLEHARCFSHISMESQYHATNAIVVCCSFLGKASKQPGFSCKPEHHAGDVILLLHFAIEETGAEWFIPCPSSLASNGYSWYSRVLNLLLPHAAFPPFSALFPSSSAEGAP